MQLGQQQRFIAIALLMYLGLATLWVLLSDRVLEWLVEPSLLMQWSSMKGMLFVLLSALGFGLTLRMASRLPVEATIEPHLTQHPTAKFTNYLSACLLVLMMLLFRLLLPDPLSDRPMMVLLLFPVIVSAVAGGFGPGLFATALAVGITTVLVRKQLFGHELALYMQIQLLFLAVNGLTVSWLCHVLRRSALRYQQQKRLLKSVIEGTNDAIFTKDLAGHYQLANQAACQAMGLSAGQILGRTDLEIFPATTASSYIQHDLKVRETLAVLHVDETLQLPNGHQRHFSVSKGPLYDADGKLAGTFGIARDVTLLKQTRDQLERVLTGTDLAYWEYNLLSRELQVSQHWWVMLGFTDASAPLTLPKLLQMIHPDDVAGARLAMKRHGSGETASFDVEVRLRMATGDWRWMAMRGKIVTYTEHGEPWLMSGTQLDVHESHQLAAAHRQANVVFENSYEGIMVVDAQGLIQRVNPAFCRITGYSAAEVVGQPPSIISSGLHDKAFYQAMWQSLQMVGSWRGEVVNKRKDGTFYSELLSISAVRDANQHILQYIGIFTDISQQKMHQAELEKVTYYDTLTGLPNRRLLSQRFEQAFGRAVQLQRRCAVCLLDLDGFKVINDHYGAAFGDQVLLLISQQLQAALRSGDTLARLGGDEFVILLNDMPEPSECHPIIERLLAAVAKPLQTTAGEFSLTGSIGVSLYPDDNADADTLLRHADKAMVQAKEAGKNRVCWFDPTNARKVAEHQLMQDQLNEALADNQLLLYYQPKVDLHTGHVMGVEALIRWQHPLRGLLAPAAFLSYVEGSDLEIPVGRWVMHQAVAQAALWHQQGLPVQVSINVGASHLLTEGFCLELRDLLQQYPQLPASAVELEILESTAISDISKASELIQRCQSLGVRFALDDFGTGYSSLTYLRSLPVQTLKIDQSFVRDMLADPEDLNIVDGVIRLAQVFGREVIAEGVETLAHGERLLQLGCKLAQGYGIARPMPAGQFADWVAQWHMRQDWLQLNDASGEAAT
ncbi:MAG TPA: GGDEF domain-containing protein [Rheinheimera sp.]|nr:GGDEF domain-containing protein [Rheinheimera sp.]